jgi:1-deoxy-D-xylulose-5-phosphate synthase
MGIATGLSPFEQAYPDRYFDVGIAEEHALTFAAGLAASGYHPVVPIYSTFLQRGYDNIIHDIALQRLPVTICIDRAGLSAADGATHHGIFDLSFLSAIPGMRIFTPITEASLQAALREALLYDGPSAIRYPNGYESEAVLEAFYGGTDRPLCASVRPDRTYSPGKEVVIVTHGRIVGEAQKAQEILQGEGISAGILLCEYAKPYDTLAAEVKALLPQSPRAILYLEEEVRTGGFGVSLSDHLKRLYTGEKPQERILAPEDSFVIPKQPEHIYRTAGVDAASVVEAVKAMLAHP